MKCRRKTKAGKRTDQYEVRWDAMEPDWADAREDELDLVKGVDESESDTAG